jgi:hypothetical protein
VKPEEVSLRRHPLHWSRLSGPMKVRVVDGLERITRVRARLSESVQVVSLPPVVVHDAVWTGPGLTGLISGRAGPVALGPHVVFGVELPVNVALADDEEAIRAVLLHEFGHCFYYMMKVLLATDAGITHLSDVVDDPYTDEAADRARLVDPAEWFTGDAASDFPYWNDPRVEPVLRIVPTIAEHFRIEPGSSEFETSILTIPNDVIAHVRELQKRQRNRE